MTPSRPQPSLHARVLGAILGRETVRRVALALAPRAIPIAPLKGVLLAHTVYADPADRPSVDIDVLVPEARFADALDVLLTDGFTRFLAGSTRNDSERCLRHPTHPVVVDLHRALFAPHRFDLPTSRVLARSSLDSALFGAPVRLLDPLDLYAHLVGHFAIDHVDARDAIHLDDLVAVARVHALEPHETAHRLVSSGLARAARYTLGVLVADRQDAFAEATVAALPADAVGASVARAARAIVAHAAPRSPAGTVPAHLLNRSFSAAARASLHALVRRLRPPAP